MAADSICIPVDDGRHVWGGQTAGLHTQKKQVTAKPAEKEGPPASARKHTSEKQSKPPHLHVQAASMTDTDNGTEDVNAQPGNRTPSPEICPRRRRAPSGAQGKRRGGARRPKRVLNHLCRSTQT